MNNVKGRELGGVFPPEPIVTTNLKEKIMEKQSVKTKVEDEIIKILSSFTEEQMKSLWVLLTMTQKHSVLWNWNIEEPYPTPTLQFTLGVMDVIDFEDRNEMTITEAQAADLLMRSAYDSGERINYTLCGSGL